MKIKFPLYARVLAWFFLNLAIVVAILGAVFLVMEDFHFTQLLSKRIDDAQRWIGESLRDKQQPDEWNTVLKEAGDANNVRFFLFRPDGKQIAGETINLPQEVVNELGLLMPQNNRPPMGGGRRGGGPPDFERGPREGFPPPDEQTGPDRGGPRGNPPPNGSHPPRFMLHTKDPSAYWVLVGMMMPPDRRAPGPARSILVIRADSFTAGGFFFDFTPGLIAVIAVIGISTLLWFPLLRGITRSISSMTRATEKIAEGRFDVRVGLRRQDELGALSKSIDQMAGRLAGLVNGQKRFLGDIAHELCSPIARIQLSLGIFEHRATAEEKEQLADLRDEVEQMSALVSELLSFSKASLGGPAVKLQSVSLRTVAEKAVAREAAGNDAKVEINIAADLHVTAEPDLLLRALANILRNAICYAADAGPITVSATPHGEEVILNVEDCGPGVPADAIPQIFDPFYRVDSSRDRETGGVGLGLAIVKTCVESCGGTVACENRRPHGLRVAVRLPLAE